MIKRYLFFVFFIVLPFCLFSQSPDSTSIRSFDSLMTAAQGMMEKKDYPNALIQLSIAEKLFQSEIPSESIQFGNLRFLQGRVSYLKRDFSQAEVYYNECKHVREKLLGKIHPDYTKCIMSIGVLFYVQGKFSQSEPYFLEAKLNYEKTVGTDNLDYAKCMNNLAGVYNEAGYYEKAETYFKKSKEIWESKAPDHPNFAISINSLAVLYTNTGDYNKAELLYLQAIEVRKKMLGETHPDYAVSLSNLATLYAFMRNYDEAEKLMLKSLQIREKIFGKKSEQYGTDLNNLGLLYKQMGKDSNLEKYFLEAKSIWEEMGGQESARYATVLKNLGAYYVGKRNYTLADSFLKIALPIYENVIGKSHPDYASVLSYLGHIEMVHNNNFAKAENFLLQARDIVEASIGVNNEYFTHNLIELFQFYWKFRKYQAATPYLIQTLHNDVNSLSSASTYLSERELSSFISDFSRRINYAFSYIPNSEEMTAECYNDILFFKGFLLNSGSQLKNYANSDTASSENFNQLRAVHRQLAAEYSKPIAIRRNVSELEEKANSIEKLLIRANRQYSDAISQVSWDQVCNKLNAGEAAVEFVHYNYYLPELTDSIYYGALLLKKGDKKPIFIKLFEERELSALMLSLSDKKADYVNGLYNISNRGAFVKKGSDQTLYDLIWKPMEKEMAGVNKVYYSPSGLLHRINLDAIPIDQDVILSDRYDLSELNSTRQLVIPNSNEVKNNLAVLYGGLIFDFDSTTMNNDIVYATSSRNAVSLNKSDSMSINRSGSWNYLLGTEREINSLERIMRTAGMEVLTKKAYDGTEESFKDIGKIGAISPRILHIATHGYFYSDQRKHGQESTSHDQIESEFKKSDQPMLRSGLIMSGGNAAWEGKQPNPGQEDGVLTAYEISQMNLSNTELVVLSACETGLGDIQGHEGVYGLQRAFKIAGVKYLIMSLWQVPDKQTSLLMTTFYKKWLEEKMTIPDAFRAAQKQLRDNGLDPYNWAGFVLVK